MSHKGKYSVSIIFVLQTTHSVTTYQVGEKRGAIVIIIHRVIELNNTSWLTPMFVVDGSFGS